MESKPAYRYRAFSVGIESQVLLSELPISDATPEVTISYGELESPEGGASDKRCVSATEDEVHLNWEQVGSFVMRGGREIVIRPVADASEALLKGSILGPCMATILQQRGQLVLHASAVVIDGKAVAFVGWKGKGKSTIAASLFRRGFPLLTDDLLAVTAKAGEPILAHPGFPQFKLWPDSAEYALAEVPDKLPKILADHEKRARTVLENFASAPVLLGGIYVLSSGVDYAMHRLPVHETFKQLVSNTFCARYGRQVFAGQIGANHLRNAARIASDVPIFRLERPSSLATLNSLADFVVEHARSL